MKIKPTLLGVLFMLTCAVFGQKFRQNTNGLIYSDQAIGKLKYIVDSLNLKFTHCETHNFNSLVQQQAKTIVVSGSQSLQVKKAIDSGKSFEEIAETLPDSVVNRNNLLIKIEVVDFDGTPLLKFKVLNTNREDYTITYLGSDLDKYKEVVKGWVYDYDEASNYLEEKLFAIYIDGTLQSSPLSEKYSRLVQYSECLVNPSKKIFFKDSYESQLKFKDSEKVRAFHRFIYKKLKRPEYNLPRIKGKRLLNDTLTVSNDSIKYYAAYLKKLDAWEATRLKKVEKLYKNDKKFREKFTALYALAKSDTIETDDEFEQYVALFVSPKEALWFKRNRIVTDWCGGAGAPRKHALAIAELAGETTEWEIFLRAHLGIMNERFQRLSNGSYIWGEPRSYIKELEALNINVSDLLLGASLRVNNASANHYFGSIYSIGCSLAESKDRIAIKQQMLEMIKDNTLDDFNRLTMFDALNYYINRLTNAEEKKQGWNELKLAMQSMPEYIRPVSSGNN